MPIIVNLDVVMAKRKKSLSELSNQLNMSLTNLSLLKNGNVRGVRFVTLEKICEALDCQPGDLIEYVPKANETGNR